MPYLLSNNFEQAVGQLTYDEVVALVEYYQGVTPTPPVQENLRMAGLFAWWERTRDLADAHAAWEVHRGEWNASKTAYFSHCGASADRQKRLARGECLYPANDVSRASTFQMLCWNAPATPRTGWRYMPTLFWNGTYTDWRLTHPTGGSNTSVIATAASNVNAGFPAGYRTIRILNWPIYPVATLSGGETQFATTDGQFTGGWPGLKIDQWKVAVEAIWRPWLEGYETAGGHLDYLIFDYEADRGFSWVKNASGYNYHPNYNPGTTSVNDLINDTQYTDAWLAERYMPIRSDWNAMNSWDHKYDSRTYRFNAAMYDVLREQTAFIGDMAREFFPDLKYVDYEDTLQAGNVYPGAEPSANHGSPLGCNRAPGSYQSRNIYGGFYLSGGTVAAGYFPGTGRTTVASQSDVRFTPTGVTSGSTVRLTLWGTNVDYVMTGGQTMLQVAQGLRDAWNAVTSGTNAIIAGITATAVDAGGGAGYVRLRPDDHFGCHVEGTAGSVVGTGTLPKTIAEYGSYRQFVEADLIMSSMVAASSMEMALWLMPYTDTRYNPFAPDTYEAFTSLAAFYNGPFLQFWNSPTSAEAEALMADVMAETDTACEGVIGTGLPTVIRSGLNLNEGVSAEKFINGRIVRRTVNPDTTVETHYQPTLEPIGNRSVEALSELTFTAVGDSADATVTDLTYSLSGAPSGATIDSSTGVFSWTPTAEQDEQTYEFTVWVTDDGEGFSQGETILVEVTAAPNQTPTIEDIDPQNASEHALFTLQVEADDDHVLDYSLTGAPAGMTIDSSTGLISWTPNETHGGNEYTVTVTVRETLNPAPEDFTPLSASTEFTVTVAETNTAPVLSLIGPKDATAGVEIAFQCSATDIDVPTQTLTYSLTGTPPGDAAITSGGAFTWTPDEDGEFSITFRVTDNGTGTLYDEETVLFTVTENEPPVLSAITTPRSATAGVLHTFTAAATDPEDDELTFSLEGAPVGAAIDESTGVFTWTPDPGQADESYDFQVVVEDEFGSTDSQTVSITVASGDAPPVLSVSNQVAAPGQLFRMFLEATDASLPIQTLTFSSGDLPSGSTLNEASGEFTWTPGFDQLGEHRVTFTVEDEQSNTDSETITITVSGLGIITDPGGTPVSFVSISPYSVLLHRGSSGERKVFNPQTDEGRGSALIGALSQATSGDVIYLAAGTYDLGSTGMVVPDGVTIIGESRDLTIIKRLTISAADYELLLARGDVTLENLTLLGDFTAASAPATHTSVGVVGILAAGKATYRWRFRNVHFKCSYRCISYPSSTDGALTMEVMDCLFTTRSTAIAPGVSTKVSTSEFILNSDAASYDSNVPCGIDCTAGAVSAKVEVVSSIFRINADDAASAIGTTDMACAVKLGKACRALVSGCFIEIEAGSDPAAFIGTSATSSAANVLYWDSTGITAVNGTFGVWVGGAADVSVVAYFDGGRMLVSGTGSKSLACVTASATLVATIGGCAINSEIMVATGTLSVSGSSSLHLRNLNDASPTGHIGVVGELAYNSTDSKLYLCTVTGVGSDGTWVAQT